MSVSPVTEKLLTYLLTDVEGFKFEETIQAMLGVRHGEQFVALGGVHDGGADGFLRSVLVEQQRQKNFVQISAVEAVPGKIKGTYERLLKFGREVSSITYWSSRKLHVDVLEESLSEELGVTVRIRDSGSVLQLVNHDAKTYEIFHSAFHREIAELAAAPPGPRDIAEFISDPSVYVFLQFQKQERFSRGGLTTPVVDALIYWSLRNTEPETDKRLTRNEIKERIAELLPNAASELIPSVDARLAVLATRDGGGHQRVRMYKDDAFCLPYAMRLELANASAGEIALQTAVRQSLARRAMDAGATDVSLVAEVCEHAIYEHFHEQGLILAAFLEKRLEDLNISDQIVENELQRVIGKGTVPDGKSYGAALKVLQGIFYSPTDEENEFLHKLSKTSMLLFSLQHCPKLIQYFNKLTGTFRLLVGTDILVKAMSESFLPAEHRHVTNLLKVAAAHGAKLMLTEQVVAELYTHMHAVCLEFKNYYAVQEPYITAPMAAQSNRIFIRTYFYAKLLMNKVKGWKSFIEMFVDYDEVSAKSDRGAAQLQAYLCKTFDLEVLSLTDEHVHVNDAKLEELAERLAQRNTSKHPALAKNDALMVLAIYGLRSVGKEAAIYDGFGLKTWWLTKETHVLKYTGDIVAREGTPYIMRPEFLLNFLSMAPTEKVDPGIQKLLPSHVGLQIGQHLPGNQMQLFLAKVDEWKELPPARREVKITDTVDSLKHDRLKRYSDNLDLNGEGDYDFLVNALREASAKG